MNKYTAFFTLVNYNFKYNRLTHIITKIAHNHIHLILCNFKYNKS